MIYDWLCHSTFSVIKFKWTEIDWMRVQSQNDHRLRNRVVLFFFKRCGFKDNSNFGDLPRKFESTTHSFYYFVESFHTSAGSLSFSLCWRATTFVHRFKIHFCTSLKCDCVFKRDEHNLDLDCDSLLLPNCMYCMCLLFVCAFNPNTFIFIFCVRLCPCICVCCCLCVYLSQVRDRVTGRERVTQAATFISLCFSPHLFLYICPPIFEHYLKYVYCVLCMQF